MARFIEVKKMSKKAQRELAAKRRKTWDVSPIPKVIESKKLYNRKKKPCSRYDDSGAGFFAVQCAAHAKERSSTLQRTCCPITV